MERNILLSPPTDVIFPSFILHCIRVFVCFLIYNFFFISSLHFIGRVFLSFQRPEVRKKAKNYFPIFSLKTEYYLFSLLLCLFIFLFIIMFTLFIRGYYLLDIILGFERFKNREEEGDTKPEDVITVQ